MLTIGIRPPPATCSLSQSYGPAFQGSPVVVIARSEERSAAGHALRDQRPDQRRRDAEHRHALLLDQPPEPVVGPVGRALHVDHGRAERAGADHRPRPHDPAHVRGEEDAVAGADVRLVGRLPGDREEEAAVHVQRALGPAGRAGRVREQVRMLRLDLERREFARPELDAPGPVGARPLDDVLDARRLVQRLLDRLAHRHACAAAERVVGGDHGLRAGVLQALDDGGRGEAGEDRHLHGADVRARMGGDGGLGRHRQVDRDPVAGADAERDERLGEPRHLVGQRCERPLVAQPVLGPEDGRDRVGRALRPRVHARLGDVQPRALEPGRPLDPARVVEDAVPGPGELELEVGGDGAPEAVGLLDRDTVEIRVALAAERLRQPGDVRRRELFRRRRPGELDVCVSNH